VEMRRKGRNDDKPKRDEDALPGPRGKQGEREREGKK